MVVCYLSVFKYYIFRCANCATGTSPIIPLDKWLGNKYQDVDVRLFFVNFSSKFTNRIEVWHIQLLHHNVVVASLFDNVICKKTWKWIRVTNTIHQYWAKKMSYILLEMFMKNDLFIHKLIILWLCRSYSITIYKSTDLYS